jgi:hypothetical protein
MLHANGLRLLQRNSMCRPEIECKTLMATCSLSLSERAFVSAYLQCRQADEANGSAFERCDRLRINAWPRPMKREASMMRRSTIDISALVLVDEEQEPEPVAKRQRPAAATMVAMLEPEKNAELLEAELDASLQAELEASVQAELEASLQAD